MTFISQQKSENRDKIRGIFCLPLYPEMKKLMSIKYLSN